jgi:phosphate starvation-inducible PhoH-like protein
LPDLSPEPADAAADAAPAVQTKIVVPDTQAMVALLGSRDQLLRLIEAELASDVHVRGNEITITGRPEDNAIAVRLFEELLELLRSGSTLTPDAVTRSLGMLTSDTTERPAEVLSLNILSRRGKNIRPKTLNQKHYVDAIDRHTVVFGIGPAGTGRGECSACPRHAGCNTHPALRHVAKTRRDFSPFRERVSMP